MLDYLARPVVESMLVHEGFGGRPRTGRLRKLYEAFVEYHMTNSEPYDVDLCLRALAATVVLSRAAKWDFDCRLTSWGENAVVEMMVRVVEAAEPLVET